VLNRRFFQIIFAASALAAGESDALAEPRIGAAEKVVNEVSRELAGEAGRLANGDAIFRNETIRTGPDSSAKLVFVDRSVARVLPGSTLILNEDVYEGPAEEAQGAVKPKMQVTLTHGVFRFTTGALDKPAYRITTVNAEIGVNGTVLDIEVRDVETRVTLVEGRAIVCPRKAKASFEAQRQACGAGAAGAKCDCVRLDMPGETAEVVGTAGSATVTRQSATPVNLAAACAGSGECTDLLTSRTASRLPGGALCGH
jgi:hypothetical protein